MKKKSDECAKEELKRAGIRIQVLKLFFQQCARDRYFDQFQYRLALPVDHPSLISNIRVKPEPSNLQFLEIDQGIERCDGQSWKDRVDLPARKKQKPTPSDAGKKASAKLFRNAPRPWFVFIFLLSSKKWTGGHQLYRPFLCLAQRQRVASTNGFALVFFSSFALKSMQWAHEIHN